MITLHGTPHYLLKRKFTLNLSKSQPYSRKKHVGCVTDVLLVLILADGKDVSWGDGGAKVVWGKVSLKQMDRIGANRQLGCVAYELEKAFFHRP